MWKRVLCNHLLALTACAAWTSCVDSGGDDGPSFRPPPPLPVNATWQLDSPSGDLTVTLDDPATVSLPVLNLAGDWNTLSGDMTVRTGGSGAAALRIVAPAFLPTDVTVVIDTPLSLPATAEHPIAGSFEVRYGASVVRVTCRPTEVDLDLDSGSQTATLLWDVFDSLDPGGAAPDYQEIASFGYGATMFVLEQLGRVVDGLDAIRTDEEDLLYAGSGISIVEFSDTYPPIGRAGMLYFSWIDDGDPASQGEPGPGDDFVVEFQEFWLDDPTDEYDELLGGMVRLIDYGEVASPFFLGFDEVRFEAFEIAETHEVTPGVFQIESSLQLDGSMRLGVSAASGG